jgi:hypothetical protein
MIQMMSLRGEYSDYLKILGDQKDYCDVAHWFVSLALTDTSTANLLSPLRIGDRLERTGIIDYYDFEDFSEVFVHSFLYEELRQKTIAKAFQAGQLTTRQLLEEYSISNLLTDQNGKFSDFGNNEEVNFYTPEGYQGFYSTETQRVEPLIDEKIDEYPQFGDETFVPALMQDGINAFVYAINYNADMIEQPLPAQMYEHRTYGWLDTEKTFTPFLTRLSSKHPAVPEQLDDDPTA